jgi:hypothetical protein
MKLGTKVISYLLLAVIANAATAPQALAGEEYLIQKAALTAAENVEGAGSAVSIVVAWSPSVKLILECTSSKLQGGTIEPMGKSKDELILEGCKNNVREINNGTPFSLTGKCEVSNTPALAIKGVLAEFNELLYNNLNPETGTSFGEVAIKEVANGGGCAYAGANGVAIKYKITGQIVAWFGLTGLEENVEHTLTFIPCVSQLLRFEGKRAFIEATVSAMKLSGGNVGKTWSAVK